MLSQFGGHSVSQAMVGTDAASAATAAGANDDGDVCESLGLSY